MKFTLTLTLNIEGFCPVSELSVVTHANFDPVDVGAHICHRDPDSREEGREGTTLEPAREVDWLLVQVGATSLAMRL
jgi:lactam utilization protein B